MGTRSAGLLDTSVVVDGHDPVVAAVLGVGRRPRGRFADLLIAATAHANGLDLHTRDAGDFAGLDGLVTVVAL